MVEAKSLTLRHENAESKTCGRLHAGCIHFLSHPPLSCKFVIEEEVHVLFETSCVALFSFPHY